MNDDTRAPGTSVARPTRDARRVLAFAQRHEPAATALCARINDRPLGRHLRAWIARDGGGAPTGALVAWRVSRDLWSATVLVLDPSAGQALGAVVQRSPAWWLSGPADSIDAIAAWIPRAAPARYQTAFAIPPVTHLPMPVDPATRMACERDIDAVTALFGDYELNTVATLPRLRRVVAQAVDRREVLVVEQDGTCVAAMTIPGRTPGYLYVEDLTVARAFRGRGLTQKLGTRLLEMAAAEGVGIWYARSSLNNMRLPELDPVVAEAWQGRWGVLPLRPPTYFRGQNRLRRAVVRLSSAMLTHRPPVALPAPRP